MAAGEDNPIAEQGVVKDPASARALPPPEPVRPAAEPLAGSPGDVLDHAIEQAGRDHLPQRQLAAAP